MVDGDNLDVLSERFGVSESVAQNIILTTSKQLVDAIKPKVLRQQLSYTDFYEIALEYEDQCDLPNCVGSMDARWIAANSPLFLNEIAIDILATCRPNFQFTSVELFLQTNPSDRRDVLNKSKLMTTSIANIPKMQLPNSNTTVPGFFVASKSFPNTINITTQSVSISNEINRRLLRAENVIYTAFLLLSKNWKCWDQVNLAVTTATKIDITIVWLIVCLHNYILMNGDDWLRNQYCPANYTDQFDDNGNIAKGKWRRDFHHGKLSRKIPMTFQVNKGSREERSHSEYFDYILNEGSVEWQLRRQ